MAGKDLTIRVRAEFGGDASELDKALKSLQAETEELTDDLKKLETTGSKAMDTIGLGAQNQLTRIQRFSSGFQGLTGRIGAGIGAIDNFAKGLAPWNQAVELAGKVVRFANEGLDAYAKTSAEAASEVAKLKKEFEGYSQAVMSTVGHVTTEILKQAMSFDQVRKELIRLGNTEVYKRLYGGQSIGVFEGTNEGDSAFANLTSGLGKLQDAARDTFKGDAWNTGAVEDALGRVKSKLDETRRAVELAKAEARELAGQAAARDLLRSARTSEGRNLDDVAGRPIGFSTSGLGAPADSIMRDQFGRDAERGALDDVEQRRVAGLTESWNKRLGEFREKQAGQKSFLESAFGTVDEINAHDLALKGLQITFGALDTAVSSSMQAWISDSMSLGLAIKKGIGDALAGVASQMAVESIKHGAFALGNLAFGNFAGAAKHGAAAATFGAGAVAAAAAARKLGASVNAEVAAQKDAEKSAGGSRSSAGGSAGSAGGLAGQGGQVINHYTIVYGEHFYSESNRMRQLDAARWAQMAVGNSYAEHS